MAIASEKVRLYFEHGFTITDEEQMVHDKLVKEVVRERNRYIKLLSISMALKFNTLKRK